MTTSRTTIALDEAGYERLRRGSETHRQELIVRLCGEVGLRPEELARVRPADVFARVHEGELHYFLTVRDDADERLRDAYLPTAVERVLDRYVESNDVGETDRVFGVSPRRLQMLVGELVDRAAEGDVDPVSGVSTADLRRLCARRRLERGIPPTVVMAVGGWTRLDGLTTDPDAVGTATVAAAFSEPTSGGGDRFRGAFHAFDQPALLLDTSGRVEHVNHRYESFTGFTSDELVGRELGSVVDADKQASTDLWETVLNGDSWRGAVAHRRADQDAVEGELVVSAVGDDSRPRGFLATVPSTEDGSAPAGGDPGSERLGRVQERVLAVDDALAGVATREGVMARTCTELVSRDVYRGAWVFETPLEEGDDPIASGNDEESTADASALAAASLADAEVRVGRAEGGRIVSVPLSNGDTDYGALLVHATVEAVSDFERRALAVLGGRVAGTLAAVEWKRLLLADAVLELELRSSDRGSLFVGASAELDCELSVEGLVPLDGESLLYYVSVADVGPEVALEYLGEVAESARLIAAASDASLLEVTAGGDSLSGELIARGANVTALTAVGGTARLTCETAPNADVRDLVEGVTSTFPGVRLVAKREVERSVRTPTEFQQALEERLTDRQRSVLQAAYHAGYFDWPRGSTAEELADSIGVSSPTLHNHLRRAQRKLLAAFFDGEE